MSTTLKEMQTVNKMLTLMLTKKNRQLKLRNDLLKDYARLCRKILRCWRRDINRAMILVTLTALAAFLIGLSV